MQNCCKFTHKNIYMQLLNIKIRVRTILIFKGGYFLFLLTFAFKCRYSVKIE